MIATFNSAECSDIIPRLAELFDGQYVVHCSEYLLRLPESVGEGFVRGIDLGNGISLSEWNCCTHQDSSLSFQQEEAGPIDVIFCLNGNLHYRVDRESSLAAEPLEGLIVAPSAGRDRKLTWGKGERVHFSLLSLTREKLLEEIECYLYTAPEDLAAAFRDRTGEKYFAYRGYYSLDIASSLQGVNQHIMAGITHTLYLRAKAWELLALIIRQYFDGSGGSNSSQRSLLNQRDVESLRQAEKILVQDLRDPPGVAELARRVGLNKNKLQDGFRHLYGTTVNRYLRDVRMMEAKTLLMEDKRQIAEIADMVGYGNSSQFARRFKEKFGMLPSSFVRTIRDEPPC